MREAIKCVHPLLFVGIGLFVLPLLVLPVGIADIIPADKAGPCGVPVFLLFVPSEFMILGLGFSAIRFFEFQEKRRKANNNP
jgi:hypothetical protein